MFTKPIDEITFEDVESFCQQWAEGVRVEYKREVKEIKGKIPKIVSSFSKDQGSTSLTKPISGITIKPRTSLCLTIELCGRCSAPNLTMMVAMRGVVLPQW